MNTRVWKLAFWCIIIIALLVRVLWINKVPVSLFGDELDVGYHAYSILKTGKDYMGNSLPIHFRSLGEFRTPLYIYSAVPSVLIFGISPMGVRLPAAIFGFLGVIFTYLLTLEITRSKNLSLIALTIIAISPWHIHYSRAGFEITLLYALFTLGLLLFLKSFKNPKLLALSAVSLGLTPWVYSTAKFYLPLTILFLVAVWWKNITKLPKKYLTISLVVFMLVTVPFGINTLTGGGVERFNQISVFSDEQMEATVGEGRERDQKASPTSLKFFQDKLFHNKYVYWGKVFSENYIKALSADFLVIEGDGNTRHNSTGRGVLYLVDILFLISGIYFLLTNKSFEKKTKLLLVYLLFSSPIPSALTIGGGSHASRLFLMVLPLTIFISLGMVGLYEIVGKRFKKLFLVFVLLIYTLSIYSYQHYYWVHYPWDSEKMWNSGWKDTVSGITNRANGYDNVIISTFKDVSLIYFVSWNQYPPAVFQKEIVNPSINIEGFGDCIKFGKFLFPKIGTGVDLYEMGKVMDNNTLYIVPFEQTRFDLAIEPERVPEDVELVFISKYASGSPAFYAFRKK